MSKKQVLIALLMLTVGVWCMAQPAPPAPCAPDSAGDYPNMIVNGSFEDTSMGLTGWTVADQGEWTICGSLDSKLLSSAYQARESIIPSSCLPAMPSTASTDCWGSWYVQTGFCSPKNLNPVSPPPCGQYAAMTDMNNPGTHVMYQDVNVPLIDPRLSFAYYFPYGGQGISVTPGPVEPPTDFFRVDVMLPGADPFDVGSGVLGNILLRTRDTLPPVAAEFDGFPYMLWSADLSAYAGKRVRIRFMESNQNGTLNVGVDDVQLRGSAFDQVFWDDYKLAALCIDSFTGAFHWNIRSCKTISCPWTDWSGVARSLNGGTLFVSSPADLFSMYFLYDVYRHKANGYFYTNQPTCYSITSNGAEGTGMTYSRITDSNTLKAPHYCPGGCRQTD